MSLGVQPNDESCHMQQLDYILIPLEIDQHPSWYSLSPLKDTVVMTPCRTLSNFSFYLDVSYNFLEFIVELIHLISSFPNDSLNLVQFILSNFDLNNQ